MSESRDPTIRRTQRDIQDVTWEIDNYMKNVQARSQARTERHASAFLAERQHSEWAAREERDMQRHIDRTEGTTSREDARFYREVQERHPWMQEPREERDGYGY
jgi:hypothetical protein